MQPLNLQVSESSFSEQTALPKRISLRKISNSNLGRQERTTFFKEINPNIMVSVKNNPKSILQIKLWTQAFNYWTKKKKRHFKSHQFGAGRKLKTHPLVQIIDKATWGSLLRRDNWQGLLTSESSKTCWIRILRHDVRTSLMLSEIFETSSLDNPRVHECLRNPNLSDQTKSWRKWMTWTIVCS